MTALSEALGAIGHPAQCPLRGRGAPYREALTLADGQRVLLRPAHRSDAAAFQRFFAGLSPRSRLLRFHGALKRVPDTAAMRLATQVAQRHVAIVALAEDGTLCAEARYAVDDDGAAEFGIAVADSHQGRGLGRALLLRLALHARESGLHQITGHIMAGNDAMLGLMAGLGATMRAVGSEVQATLPLSPAP
jgi:acetyltransferase